VSRIRHTSEWVNDDVLALFTFGRIGADDPRLSMSGPAASGGIEFKRWFPGP
jgi:hypothetical protein